METIAVLAVIFVAFPWVIFHYITKWKSAATLTAEDENLLDDLHELARRLDDRLCSVERIMTAENPNWRQVACDPAHIGIEDQSIRQNLGQNIGQSIGRTSR